ncbi:MAG TPA: N-acetyltransferase [Bacteroidales bacterium]|nr:N-acetyltransferase [Bacteroidales bacterium]
MIKIQAETKNDYQAIRDVNELAFGQMDEALLVEQLRQRDAFIPELSLVAREGTLVVGHILFFPVKIAGVRKQWDSLALAPMSVLPEYQNLGIGSMLVRKGIEKAADNGFTNINVLGHPRYYPRFGFVRASLFTITSPFAASDESVMVLEIRKNSLKNVKGIITYPPEYF